VVLKQISKMVYGIHLGIIKDKFGLLWNFVYC
jgi:uncharacterized glyoxalase superfamily protein PhnB